MKKPERPPGWHKVSAVRPGDTYASSVEGGVVRKAVKAAGILVEMDDRDVFIDADVVALKLCELGFGITLPKDQKILDMLLSHAAIAVVADAPPAKPSKKARR